MTALEALFARVRARTGDADLSIPTPHVTLVVLLESPPLAGVDEIIERVAIETRPFPARARGFGVFADEDGQLVLYAPVVRSTALNDLHRSLFEAFTSAGVRVDGYYHPGAWLPHITLCNGRLTPELLGTVVTSLAGAHMLTWRLPVHCLARFGPGVAARAFPMSPSADE
jgi:2'-5' RNA ligase